MMIANMAAGKVSMIYGAKGSNLCVTTACASGTHAIGEAMRAIRHGYLDVCLAGGAEAPVTRSRWPGSTTCARSAGRKIRTAPRSPSTARGTALSSAKAPAFSFSNP
jgi:3-oxoacyl-(acyl-carrier-protein) synthase